MNHFLYKSKNNPNQAVTVARRSDMSLFLPAALFLSEEENHFNTISDIEEFLGDELELIVRQQ